MYVLRGIKLCLKFYHRYLSKTAHFYGHFITEFLKDIDYKNLNEIVQ